MCARVLARLLGVGESPPTPTISHLILAAGIGVAGDVAALRADQGASTREVKSSLGNLTLPALVAGKPRPGSTWPPRAVGRRGELDLGSQVCPEPRLLPPHVTAGKQARKTLRRRRTESPQVSLFQTQPCQGPAFIYFGNNGSVSWSVSLIPSSQFCDGDPLRNPPVLRGIPRHRQGK